MGSFIVMQWESLKKYNLEVKKFGLEPDLFFREGTDLLFVTKSNQDKIS